MRARTRIALLVGCLLVLLSAAARADAVSLQPVGDFSEPIFMTSPPGDPRLFVVERAGRIQVVDDGVTSEFLDIHTMTTEDGERGLLSMAFDPHYATNGLFYVFYTGDGTNSGGTEGDGHVDEFQVSNSDPDVADLASRRPVLTISRPNAAASNHNGGQLQFGKDGYLYISVGDGGTGGSTAPNLSVLNGKLLRIDPHGAAAGDYSIPPDNPYASSILARHEIWSSGFRNPWRFSVDRLTGDLVIGDVGQTTWEEIDFAPASAGLGRKANFGWPSCEGFNVQGSLTDPCTTPGVTNPVFAYPHDDPGGGAAFGCAIMGGYVYRGREVPELAGRYLYADLCQGELRSTRLGLPLASDDRSEGITVSPNSFGEDSSCELYVTDGSTVDKIVSSSPPSSVPACTATAPPQGSPPGTPAGPGQTVRARKSCRKRHKKRQGDAASAKKHEKKRCKKHKKKHRK
jgi:glucose/arabinose dehydrogenase